MRLLSFLLEMLQTREDIVLQQVLDKQDKMIQNKKQKTFYIYLFLNYFELLNSHREMFSKQGMFAYTEHCMTSLQNLGWEECDIFLEVFRSKAQDAALCLIAHLKKKQKKKQN